MNDRRSIGYSGPRERLEFDGVSAFLPYSCFRSRVSKPMLVAMFDVVKM